MEYGKSIFLTKPNDPIAAVLHRKLLAHAPTVPAIIPPPYKEQLMKS